jgi:muconolactone delta-isomerase
MLFLVELDRVQSGNVTTPDAGRAFIERIILPTLALGERLVEEKRILSGGAVLGQVALRFIMEADSSEQIDRVITSLPVWRVAETRVTPLVTLAERREHVTSLLAALAEET